MTLPEFLQAYQRAIGQTDARPLTGPAYAPVGGYIRFLLPPAAATRHPSIPPVVDPIGLVWAAKHQDLRGPLESTTVGAALGLDVVAVAALILAADTTVPRRLRTALLEGLARCPKDIPLPHL